MKELDLTTLELVRFLDEHEARLKARYRNLVIVVVWLDGNEHELIKWAQKHNLSTVPLAIIKSDDDTLHPWRLNSEAGSTTVALQPRRPQANFVDLVGEKQFTAFEQSLETHFERWIRN